MNIAFSLLGLVLAAASGCDNNPEPYGDFENKVYIDGNSNVATLLVKESTLSDERSFYAATPNPVDRDVRLLFEADENRVADYNRLNGEAAEMLPEDFFEIENGDNAILSGSNRSGEVTVHFRNLSELNTTSLHVLPVTLRSADGIAVLESARTIWYVLRGSAIINVVANLEDGNYISFQDVLDGKSESCKVLNGLTGFTMEALIRCRGTVLDAGIKTIMGIEGHCLIRISDNNLEPNQLQVVLPSGAFSSNFTDKNTCLIEPEKWTHIAVTCDTEGGGMAIYIDGKIAYTTTGIFTAANLGTPAKATDRTNYFNIGYSYEAGRELDGDICECRIWNIVRTQEQIASNFYEVDPESEGLVAYWKFDEGSGGTIRDYSGNGNNGTAHASLKWTSVSLPEKSSDGTTVN